MLEGAFNFVKGLFLNPEGGIKWRTLLIAGAGAAVGGFSGLGILGVLLGAATGVAASAAWEYMGSPTAAGSTQPPVAAPGAQTNAGGQAPQVAVSPPQGLPPMSNTPPIRGI